MNSENSLQLNIAFATSDQIHLDQHLGSCQSLTIYTLTPISRKQLAHIEFSFSQGHNPQKITERLTALQGCFAVYCLACGTPVRQQLLAQGTRVIIKSEGHLIRDLLQQIQSHWPEKIALRQQRQASKRKESDYLSKLAESEWD